MRLPARPQRRRQDDDDALDHGPGRRRSAGAWLARAATSPAGQPYRVARAGIGFVPEDRRIFAELTVWENLDIAARAARRPGRWTIAAIYELFPQLAILRRPAWAVSCPAASSRC